MHKRKTVQLIRDAYWVVLVVLLLASLLMLSREIKEASWNEMVLRGCYTLLVLLAGLLTYLHWKHVKARGVHLCTWCGKDMNEGDCGCRVCTRPGCNNVMPMGYPHGWCPTCLRECCVHGNERGRCDQCDHAKSLQDSLGKDLFGPTTGS